ncbi:MAG: lysophospholipid acyltransferase family protein [Nitrospiraceae bacterium]|nr:lysophospholipid acyltransferase family protein [Nitrospiraceae bacterium]
MSRLFRFLQFCIVVLITLPIAALPLRLAVKAGDFLGSLLFLVWSGRRKIAVDNLSAAVSRGALALDAPPEQIVKQMFRNLGRSFVEVVKIYYGLGDRIVRSVRFSGVEHFQKAREKGKGILFITGHCGNWELNALAVGLLLSPVSVVARPVDNPYFNRLVERARRRNGNSVIYKKGALRKILGALHHDEVVGILMDQSVVPAEGIAADFLGRKDFIMKTPALLALKTGAAVIPAFIRRTDDGHVIEIGAEVEPDRSEDAEQSVRNSTVAFSRPIEDYIRRNPSEWLWIHRRWKRSEEANADNRQ